MRSVVAVSERVTTKHYTNAHAGLEFGDAPQPSWSLEVEVSASLLPDQGKISKMRARGADRPHAV